MLARIVVVVTLTLFCSIPLSALASRTLTLDECIALGLKSNPAVRSAQLMKDWSAEGVKEARSDFLPSVSASSSISNYDNIRSSGPSDSDYLSQTRYTYNVRVSQILYAGSRVFNTYSKAMAQNEVKTADQEFAEANLILKIETAFFQLMKAREDVTAMQDTVKRLRSSLESATAFYQQSMAPYVEVLQAKVDLADAEEKLSQLQNNIDRTRAELFQLINIPFSETITFTGNLDYYPQGTKTTPEACWENAIDNRSDLKSLRKQVEMVDRDIKIAGAKYLPVVKMDVSWNDSSYDYNERGISGTTSYDRDQENQYWVAGVSATWDLFDGGRAWYQKSKYTLQKLSLKEDIQALENDINAQIRTELLTMAEAESRIISTTGAQEAAREYYKTEEKRFQAGIATVPSLLDAQARMTRADANHNQALLDYQLARAGLKFIIGKKTDKNLP